MANRYDIVCVESLNMKAMTNKGFGNGKATLDNGYGMFLDMLKYKLHDRGKFLVRVDKWYPSSQICHCCGSRNPEVKDLRVRRWTCPDCGTTHDRDHNAAINIKKEGLRLLKEAA
ncbi:MAG: RNA-guided endonuclease TnpB family protein [Lachnospiraceae bacterium]